MLTENAPDVETKTPAERGEVPEPYERGALLTKKDEKVVKLLRKMWEASDPYMKKRLSQWKVNVLRRRGIPGVGLQKTSDGWEVWTSPDISGPDHVPIINKAAEIARKFNSILLADPFKPKVIPEGTSHDEVLSAQIATRILEYVDGEAMLSEDDTMRKAFDKASDYGSGFVHYYVDPEGGQRVPVQIEATPFATHEDNALIDPYTQAPAAPPYVKKYVTEDGTLTDDPSLARMRDLPVLRREILTGRNVRFVPHTAEDIWDAEGVLIGSFVPIVKLRNRFPELLEELEKESNHDRLEKVISYRPSHAKDIAQKGQKLDVPSIESGDNYENAMVFVLTAYFRKSTEYPNGAVAISLGNEELAHKQTWSFTREDGTEEALDIPITQYAQFYEGDDDPYYHGIMEIVGKANEMRNTQASAIIEAVERMANRKVFIPTSAMTREEDLENPAKKYIPIADGSAPVHEQLPQIPQDIWHMYNEAGVEMDRAPGLSETVQGLESSTVKSGRHALSVVQQAHASLSSVKNNLTRGFMRGARVKLQLLRAFFDAPQSFPFDEDEYFKMEAWRGADLSTSKDVRVAPGTGTMLTPAAKAQLAEHWFSLGLIPPDDMQRISAANIGPILGMQTDPFRTRIKRQLFEWHQGPPEGWSPPPPQVQMDPQTGQPVPIPTPDPVLMEIFEPVPADMMPAVAQIRVTEISRVMSGERYMEKPKEWRQGLDMEFQRMQMAVMGQMMANPNMPGPNQAAAQVQSGSPDQQSQAKDMLGMGPDQDPNANSSERLNPTEQAMAGDNL